MVMASRSFLRPMKGQGIALVVVIAVALMVTPSYMTGVAPGHGGPSTSTVTGTVSINDTSPLQRVPGAYVEIPRLNLYAYTDSDGRYTIKNVPWGKYYMRASAVGYTSNDRFDLIVGFGGATTIYVDYVLTLTPTQWLLMFYSDYDVDLYVSNAWFDMMNAGANATDSVRILALQDRNTNWDGSDNNNARLYEFRNHQTILLEDEGELNMADPTTLSDFVVSGMTRYPAANYALVMFDHGVGWEGLCQDYHSSVYADQLGYPGGPTVSIDILTLIELESAFATVRSRTNELIDLVAFRACSMQMIEVGYQIRKYARVMVGSEDEMGVPTDESILKDVIATPSMDARALGRVFVNRFADVMAPLPADLHDTYSAIDLLFIDGVSAPLNTFSKYLYELLPTKRAKIESCREDAREFLGGNANSFIDFYHFLTLIEASRLSSDKTYVSSINSIKTAFTKMMIAEWHDNTGANAFGLSIFFPEDFSAYSSGRVGSFDIYIERTWGCGPALVEGYFPEDALWWRTFIVAYLDPYDVIAPYVEITSPTKEPFYTTNTLTITLSGMAYDAYDVAKVEWSFYDATIWQTATGTSTWTFTTTLVLDPYLPPEVGILVRAYDSDGNYAGSQDQIIITYAP